MYLLELRLSEDASKKVFWFLVFVREFLTLIPMKYDCQPAILVVLKTGEKCIKFRNGRKNGRRTKGDQNVLHELSAQVS